MDKSTTKWHLLIITALLCTAWAGASHFEQYSFKPVTRDSVIDLLTPLFVVAMFLERAQEVFISAWRDIDKSQLERNVAKAKNKGVASELLLAEDELEKFKCETRRAAFLAGLIIGVVISAIGIRVLQPLVVVDPHIGDNQLLLFDTMDVILTGGLIGGGSEGIHKIVTVLTDFLDVTRQRIAEQDPRNPERAAAKPAEGKPAEGSMVPPPACP